MLERASDFLIEDDEDELEMEVVLCVTNRIAKNGQKLVCPRLFSPLVLVLVPSLYAMINLFSWPTTTVHRRRQNPLQSSFLSAVLIPF
jgi:hypothetical protein